MVVVVKFIILEINITTDNGPKINVIIANIDVAKPNFTMPSIFLDLSSPIFSGVVSFDTSPNFSTFFMNKIKEHASELLPPPSKA